MLFGKARVFFEEVERISDRQSGEYDVPTEMRFTREYGGGRTHGVVRVRVNQDATRFVRPVYPEGHPYWSERRAQVEKSRR